MIVIVRDHQQQSYIEMLNAESEETIWKQDCDEPNTWATPSIVSHGGSTQIIIPGSNKIRSYNLNIGEILWQ
ncbi:MAG: hypothetical protein M2R45_05128 [Verrucomicrobia subdivision 3 bacterium]|nr:hypothetical protein [Limisphaerales bacterium]MCS1417190.1 hypothetical protein [Limisphaerales bacterium]